MARRSVKRSPMWPESRRNVLVCCWILCFAGSEVSRCQSWFCRDDRAAHAQLPTRTCTNTETERLRILWQKKEVITTHIHDMLMWIWAAALSDVKCSAHRLSSWLYQRVQNQDIRLWKRLGDTDSSLRSELWYLPVYCVRFLCWFMLLILSSLTGLILRWTVLPGRCETTCGPAWHPTESWKLFRTES